MKHRIIASIIVAAASFLFIAGSAVAAPTSTIVQNLVITGVPNAQCLTTGSNGLVASTTCGSGGGSSTISINGVSSTVFSLNSSTYIGITPSGTTFTFTNLGVTSTNGLAKGSGISSLALWNASGTLTGYGSAACPNNQYLYILNSDGSITCSQITIPDDLAATTVTSTWVLSSNGSNWVASAPTNQTITLTGAVTGSGATTIATTLTTSTLYSKFSASNPITFNTSTGAIGWTNSLGYSSTSTGLTTANFATTSIGQWNNNSNFISLLGLSGSAPITYNTSTGAIGLTIPLTLAQGGTNATSAAAARTSLGLGTISTFASTDYIPSSTNMVNTFNGATGTVTYAPSSTLASSSVSFIFQNATTTKPYSFENILTNTKKTIAYVDCYEYAAATTTMELYYNTTNASTGIQQVILPSIPCGIGGNSTTTFTTSTLPLGAYLFAIVSSTAGTPTQTAINISAVKL